MRIILNTLVIASIGAMFVPLMGLFMMLFGAEITSTYAWIGLIGLLTFIGILVIASWGDEL